MSKGLLQNLFQRVCALSFVLVSVATTGCAGGLDVKRVNSAQEKPNNVWVFFTVKKGDEPVGGLQASDFKIYEDGQLISEFESKQTIQNPDVAAVMYTLLLIDMSGSITESGSRDDIVDAAKSFSDKIGKSQKVGVYAFDGSEKLTPIVRFTEAGGSVDGGLERLRTYKPKDPSTNLYGAVVNGLQELETELKREQKPLKFGTLVVFTDGTDRAARISKDDMSKEMDKEEYENYEMFAIGVGGELDESYLGDIGRDGTELVSDRAKVKDAFDKIATRIERHTKRFYLLSYCTPSRAGKHEVTIEAHSEVEPKGTGTLEYAFDAEGFGPPPECNPDRAPRFDLKDTEEKEQDEPDDKSSGDSGGSSSGFSVEGDASTK